MTDSADSFETRAAGILSSYCNSISLSIGTGALNSLVAYARLIDKWNRLTSLVRANNVDAIVANHIVDCLSIVPLLDGARVADIGSGAGLPGIVAAIVRHDLTFYLVESNERRARFMRQAAIELEIDNIEVINLRVEDWQPDKPIDCITSRAYSALDKFCSDTAHLRHGDCRLIAMRGRVSEAELAAVASTGDRVEVIALKVPGLDHRNAVVISGCVERGEQAPR